MTRSADEEPTPSAPPDHTDRPAPPDDDDRSATPPAGTPGTAGSDPGSPEVGTAAADPAPESRPSGGVRWSDAPPSSAAPSSAAPSFAAPPPRDSDATPPSGLAPPGRTTAVAPAPTAVWSGANRQPGANQQPGSGQQPWQQTAPGWAPPPPRDPARTRRTRRIVLAVVLGVVVLAAVVVALLAFLVGPRFARYDVLDRAAVERGVTEVVTRDWRRPATAASCPDDVRVRPGATFTCTVTIEGRPRQVPVDVVDDAGTYEVGQPR